MITIIGSVMFSNKKPLKLQPKSELKGLSYLLVKIIFLTALLIASCPFSTNLENSAGFLVKFKFKRLVLQNERNNTDANEKFVSLIKS
jgi:hypothetical protein